MAVVNRKIDLLLKQMQEMKESKIMNPYSCAINWQG
jgi:hypothetical protein